MQYKEDCKEKIRIKWTDKVSYIELTEQTCINNINMEIKKRRWKYIGRVLRMDIIRHVRKALRLIPAGRRKPGRPKGTCRRTLEGEMKTNGINRGEMGEKGKRQSWMENPDGRLMCCITLRGYDDDDKKYHFFLSFIYTKSTIQSQYS